MLLSAKLTSPRVLQDLLRRHDFRVKKKLGQNFLVDANILDKIIRSLAPAGEHRVLEIGPGVGTLTRVLARKANHVVALELDLELFPVLEETLRGCSNITLVHGDAAKTDLGRLMETAPGAGPVVVVGNLPYYATTPIIFNFLGGSLSWERAVFMVQKEVAQRMVARPGTKEYGALTVTISYYTEVETAAVVSPDSFYPRPEVESAVIRLDRRAKTPGAWVDSFSFSQVVRAAFAYRRKTLENALTRYPGLGLKKSLVRPLLVAAGIEPSRRGETLSVEEFTELAFALGPFLRRTATDGEV